MNYCNVLFYLIFVVFDAFYLFTYVGYFFQLGGGASLSSGSSLFYLAIAIVIFVFYIGATYYSYEAYKEFKGMFQDQYGMRDPYATSNLLNYGNLAMNNAGGGGNVGGLGGYGASDNQQRQGAQTQTQT
mmetsp:Transcript_24794/g.24306  ORF Transcript_24794/g.24306 Transcript_24794/m.24306 type:complete len:129 (+) Transcript_24794:205-591(+)|eukprot:CAMPEP_0170554630 /NCGR_PEP_ID=MMETSP0211-20121228/12512_1 /TAXON_ID=311385 /ORGANISM="Pseudokeronopsis sp., Strain OXSARD2" /LENGTH=128 /DNA_ID=CAMNT_0010863869 /DNA_START=164 /DNA_END=550 /DNA_ORIENTATION=+